LEAKAVAFPYPAHYNFEGFGFVSIADQISMPLETIPQISVIRGAKPCDFGISGNDQLH
jgi:hypothetical protein